MGDKSKIEWCDATWNPTYGCGGCELGKRCYAARMASRFPDNYSAFETDGEGNTIADEGTPLAEDGKWTGEIAHAYKRLELPFHWKKPRRIFVDSMGDLFAPGVTDSYLRDVWRVMLACERHTFMILTKQPVRMARFVSSADVVLPNVWLGVSVTDQATADQRIPLLLQTPAAVRFVSAEPMLSEINFRWAPWEPWKKHVNDHLDGLRRLNWIIAGPENGPGKRPMKLDWARGLRDQCQAAKVPFFYKGGKLDGREWKQFPNG